MDTDDGNDELARRLLAARARPSDEFVDGLERRLFARRKSQVVLRRQLAGLFVGGAVASALVVASLLGAGPLTVGSDGSVRADKECVPLVRTIESRGELRQSPDGTVTVQAPTATTPFERHCR